MLFLPRRRAVHFRRALADLKHDKDSLQELYDNQKREGIENLVKSLESVKEEDREELIEILDSYFDTEKKPVSPPVNPSMINKNHHRDNGNNGQGSGRNIRRRGVHNMNKENRGPRNDSRRRRRPMGNKGRRFSGNGNVELHDADQQKQQNNIMNHPQIISAAN